MHAAAMRPGTSAGFGFSPSGSIRLSILFVLVLCGCGARSSLRADQHGDSGSGASATTATSTSSSGGQGGGASLELVSEIRFQDIHLVSGNPRKINPNTVSATEPDNQVRLYVVLLDDDPPPMSFTWSTDLGSIVSEQGAEIVFASAQEGLAHISCTATDLSSGDVYPRQLTINIEKAVQGYPIIRGDYVLWTVSPHEVHGVHLPTRKAIAVGPGGLTSFDGKWASVKPPTLGDREIVLYNPASGTSQVHSPPSLKAAWDYRHIVVSGGQLYWATTDTSYEHIELYHMALDKLVENHVYTPDPGMTMAPFNDLLMFGEAFDGGLFGNHLFTPAQSLLVETYELNALGMVVSYHPPWVALRDYSGFRLHNAAQALTKEVTPSFGSVIGVELTEGYYGGQAREPFGDEGELFLVALDGSVDERIHFDTNDFLFPSVDGPRIVWVQDQDIYLFEAGK